MRLLKIILFINFFHLCMASQAQQGVLQVKVSKDTIGVEEILHIEYILENIEGQFTPPAFEDFIIFGGPNTMSSMSIINGQKTQIKSYSFLLKPKAEGEIIIEGATVNDGETRIETELIKIVVTDNKPKSEQHKIEKSYPLENQKNIIRQTKRPIKRI